MHFSKVFARLKKDINISIEQFQSVSLGEVMSIPNSFSIDKEENLVGINLSSNSKITESIDLQNFTSIKRLCLDNCQIHHIDNTSSLVNLTHLSLSSCGYRFDEGIGKYKMWVFIPFDTRCLKPLSKLKFLDLSNNQYDPNISVPSVIYSGDLGDILNLLDLEELYLSRFFIHNSLNHNNRTKVTNIEKISTFKKLKILDLSNNNIEENLLFLTNLPVLEILNLKGNKISEISFNFINNLPNINELFISKNPIKNIPKEIFDRDTNVWESIKTYLRSLTKSKDIIDYDNKITPRNLTPPPFLPDALLERGNEMESIRSNLFKNDEPLLLVSGMGGVGKTTLAARYYHVFSEEYLHRAWVFVEDNIIDGLLSLALSLNVVFPKEMPTVERLEVLVKAMINLSKPCLLVLDNVNDINDLEEHFLTLNRLTNFHVLITTRITSFGKGNTYRVGLLSLEDSIRLFHSHCPSIKSSANETLKKLLQLAEGNSLAIELLAKSFHERRIVNKNYSLDSYLSEINKQSQINETNSPNNVYAVISSIFNFKKLRNEEMKILSYFSILPSEEISINFFRKLGFDTAKIEEGIVKLINSSFLSSNFENKSIKIHPLIQQIVHVENVNLLEDCKPLIDFLTQKLEYREFHLIGSSYEDAISFARYADSVVSLLKESDLSISLLCERLGKFYSIVGDSSKSLHFFQHYNQRQKDLCIENPSNLFFQNGLANSYSKLGTIYTSFGQLEKALSYFEKAQQLSKKLVKAEPEDEIFQNSLAKSYSNLGVIYISLGSIDKALSYFEKENALFYEMFKLDPHKIASKVNLANSFSNLGSAYSSLNNFEKAFFFYEKENVLLKEMIESNQDNVTLKNSLAFSFSNIGELYSSIGQLNKAITFFEKALEISLLLYNSYNLNVLFKRRLAIVYSRFGTVYSALDKYEKALFYFKKENEIYAELVKSFPYNIIYKNGLAYSFYNLGSIMTSYLVAYGEAIQYYEEALLLFNEIQDLSPKYSSNFQTISELHKTLGEIKTRLGYTDEALKNFSTANQIKIVGNQNIVIQDISNSTINVNIGKNTLSGSTIVASSDIYIGDVSKKIEELNTEYLHQAKMILIGNGAVGKSSVVFRLFDKTNPLPPRIETKGFDVNSENYVIEKLSPEVTTLEKEIDFTLQIWDFGGQGRYREVQNLFCSRKAIYVFVTSVDDVPLNDDYIGYEYWLSMAKIFGYDQVDETSSPIIHVLNKIDLPEYKGGAGLSFDLRERYQFFENFIAISCENINDNNFASFEKAIRELLPKIGKNSNDIFLTRFRKNWFTVKNELENKVKLGLNFISYDDYLELCSENDLDQQEAEEWISYLDRIGALIHFKENESLKKWVFLNTRWVKDAFVDIVDSKLLLGNNGKLTEVIYETVWSDYESEDHEKFIDLMEANNFCYFNGTFYVVPTCLPVNPPVFPDFLLSYDFELAFLYNPFIPAGTVNKIITRHHGSIHSYNEKLNWKNGLVIHDRKSNSYLKIIENWEEKRIEVSIKSDDPKTAYDFVNSELNFLNKELEESKYLGKIELETRAKHRDKYYEIEDLNEINEAKNKYWFLFDDLLKRVKSSNITKDKSEISSRSSKDEILESNSLPKLLIMKGGGAKGLSYVGAIRELNEYYSFNWFAGTSAGAIAAVLLGAGYSTDELEKILAGKDFTDFLDSGFFGIFPNLLKGGMYKAEAFTNWLDKLLAKKLDLSVRVLLGDLPNRVSLFASTEDKSALIFDSSEADSKEIPVAYAVRCSMAIPLIFTPESHSGNKVYDGGMQNNYPVDILLKKYPNLNFIGLYLGDETYEGRKKKSFLGRMISIWSESTDIESLGKYHEQTIVIDPRPISTIDFKLREDEKSFLIEVGRLAAQKLLIRRGFLQNDQFNSEKDTVEITRTQIKKRFFILRRIYTFLHVLIIKNNFLIKKISQFFNN